MVLSLRFDACFFLFSVVAHAHILHISTHIVRGHRGALATSATYAVEPSTSHDPPNPRSRLPRPPPLLLCLLLDDNAMFDAADLIALPVVVPGAGDGVPRRDIAETAGNGGGVLNRNLCHVIEACAMGGHDVALAMSNGELCHANISQARPAAPELVPTEDKRWPRWTSWPTRQGKVLSLQYDPAHDALVTIEVST